jgi:exodeoxyribonuclease VII large subunit
VVGVVTSRDGAAFQDFLRTRSQRWPGYPVRLAHTIVQGPEAAAAIAAAIARLDASGVDVICVVRGGGSLEDLWAFNELPVLEAIRAASVPVVSGVGHETDTTLADLVADRRAHTPTDAAQAVLPDRRALVEALERARRHLARAVDGLLERRGERLARAGRLRLLAEAAVERAGSRAARLGARLAAQAPAARLERLAGRLERAAPRLAAARARALEARAGRLATLERALGAVSPFAVLERGYTITRRAGAAAPLTDAGVLRAGEQIETLFHAGSARARVEHVEREPRARS